MMARFATSSAMTDLNLSNGVNSAIKSMPNLSSLKAKPSKNEFSSEGLNNLNIQVVEKDFNSLVPASNSGLHTIARQKLASAGGHRVRMSNKKFLESKDRESHPSIGTTASMAISGGWNSR